MKENFKVMIVDDSFLIAQKVRNALIDIDGLTFIGHAKDADEADTILKVITPDIILLDIKMPGKSGVDLLLEIRIKHKDIVVIMMTNFADYYYRNLCLQMGADYFFDKTTEIEKLFETIKNIACIC